MDLARPGNPTDLFNLTKAAQYLAVSIDVLLAWNEHDILKPTITSNGEIVYTKSQLDKFKAIQNNSKLISHETEVLGNSFNQKPAIPSLPIDQKSDFQYKQIQQQQNNFSQINNYHFHNNSSNPTKEIKASISIKKLAFTLSFFGILLLFLTVAQQSKINSLLYQNPEKGVGYDSHSATLETTNNKTGNNINNEGSKVVKNSPNLNKDNNGNSKTSTTESDQNKLSLIESVLGINSNDPDKNKLKNEIATYGQKSNLRTTDSSSKYSNKSDTLNDVFDTEGNIKVSKDDPSEKELLATALGTSGLTRSQDLVRQNSNTAGAITFIILGLILIYFIYSSKRQLLPASGNYNQLALQPVSYNTQNDLEWEKILEVDQKTDGSVVIIFHGKEYKLSKPELDSESDKFIERLMQLTNSGLKEIEYDALSDNSLVLNTPLSKIVTRLGFVGIKRDLFFPRTSKSRVLFRKYLTLDDLFSMNMTIEDLSEKFSNIN